MSNVNERFKPNPYKPGTMMLDGEGQFVRYLDIVEWCEKHAAIQYLLQREAAPGSAAEAIADGKRVAFEQVASYLRGS